MLQLTDEKTHQKTVRTYPLPYVTFRVAANHLMYVTERIRALAIDNPNMRHYQLGQAGDRMTVCMAFADVYDKEDQFLKTPLERYKYDQQVDFIHGNKRIKIVPSRVNAKYDNTGPRVEFKMNAKTLRASEADWFILAAFSLPNVQFLGMVPKEAFVIRGWNGKVVIGGAPSLVGMADLSLEAYRRKGIFV